MFNLFFLSLSLCFYNMSDNSCVYQNILQGVENSFNIKEGDLVIPIKNNSFKIIKKEEIGNNSVFDIINKFKDT